MQIQPEWAVYRDGYRWTVWTWTLLDALHEAHMSRDGRVQYVDLGKRRVVEIPPGLEGVEPVAMRGVQRTGETIPSHYEMIYLREDLGPRVVQVVVERGVTLNRAAAALARAQARLDAAKTRAETETVRGASGEPVSVRYYTSGAAGLATKGLLGLHLAGRLVKGVIEWDADISTCARIRAEIEQAGGIKWPSKQTPAAERARVLAGITTNERLAEAIEDCERLVAATEDVVTSLAPRPKRLDELDEAGLRERRDQIAAELGAVDPNSTARHEILARLAAADRRLDPIDSVHAHGFAVGEIVDVLPAPWDDEQTTRRARVVEVVVEHERTYLGREPMTEHRRVVEFFSGDEPIRPTVDRLRKVSSPA